MYKIRTSEYRVGIVGMYNSGKTVLLMSLLNHLQEHDPQRFCLGDGTVTLRKFEELDPDRGWPRFNYRGFRDRLVKEQRWPQKTKDRSQYVCRFERSDLRLSTAKLKLYDLPGERIADAIMVGKDYAGWSDHMLGVLENDHENGTCCDGFLRALASGTTTTEELLREYRVALAQMILNYKPYVSPSTFYVDTQGQMVEVRTQECKARSAQTIADERHAGLAADAQFAPLSIHWRDAHADETRVFAERYERYKFEVVLPWVRAVKSCHSLIFLVDVLTILASGHGMYNDMLQIICDLLEVLDPGNSLLGRAIRGAAGVLLPHSWRPGRITRIAFAAPKLDLVYPDQRGKMIDLVRGIAERRANDRDGLKALYTNCGAAVSTRALPYDGNGRYLSGLGQDLAQERFLTPELPPGWPQEWSARTYVFPRVRPYVPQLRDSPPDQVNLDKLLDFVMA